MKADAVQLGNDIATIKNRFKQYCQVEEVAFASTTSMMQRLLLRE